MTDAQLTAARLEDVRAAAGSLKAAIDRHLAAVEARTGEGDVAVQDSYTELHDAAERYDDLLFEVYDEVTPFVLAEGPHGAVAEVADVGEAAVEPSYVSLLARWDLEIVDRDALVEAGHSAAREPWIQEAEGAEDFDEASDISMAFGQLIDAYGRDQLVDRAEDFGLTRQGMTTWLVGLEAPDDEEWMDAAFSDIDERRLVYRVDEIYLDEDEEEIDDTAL